jgi:hypothetical protein
VSHTLDKYYTIGFSALRSSGDMGYEREELGADFWIHPIKNFDLTGRSSYNSDAHDWMEHAYSISVIPHEKFRINFDLSDIKYRYYFSDTQTSTVFKLGGGVINPNEEMTAYGTILSYLHDNNLSVSGDYRFYEYEIADSAHYFGGKIAYSKPESFAAGASVHRMQGEDDLLRYTEYRLYASKKFKNLDFTLDLIEIYYDQPVNDVRDAFTAAAAVVYRMDEKLKLAADVDYSSNPAYYNEVRALVKLTYAFDMKYASEGRAR